MGQLIKWEDEVRFDKKPLGMRPLSDTETDAITEIRALTEKIKGINIEK